MRSKKLNNVSNAFSLAYQTQDPTKPNIPALMKLVEIVQRYNGKIYMGSFPSEVRPESVTPEAVSTSCGLTLF